MELVIRLRGAGCVFAEDEAALLAAAASGAALEDLVRRRIAGEPLEHLLGWADFDGVRVALDPGVFIPRQRTAFLVELASSWVPAGGVVVDLCCGSGALGLALARRHPGITLHAADIDPVAVACAQRNLAGLGTAQVGDLDAALPADLRGRVDVLVANVPYVPTDAIATMPAESRDHEPRGTVDGGADGLDVVRRLAARAPHWLVPSGRVLVETSEGQADVAAAAFAEAGLAPEVHHDEERGATVVSGWRTPATSR
ncbi:putative protein N(5)-glutamine methyltransferase [Nocardioides humilatus]|uniref:peptide chain release factor N(5)-glutamine methyltransferase n=2 Tax=Nocardioides humilatus TaxID=2607660 RepID=A0A5B1LN55_9ACTN|nr:putative protein N(5)-glutamine methyltransferase [Nocardioides humilatus]